MSFGDMAGDQTQKLIEENAALCAEVKKLKRLLRESATHGNDDDPCWCGQEKHMRWCGEVRVALNSGTGDTNTIAQFEAQSVCKACRGTGFGPDACCRPTECSECDGEGKLGECK